MRLGRRKGGGGSREGASKRNRQRGRLDSNIWFQLTQDYYFMPDNLGEDTTSKITIYGL